MPTQKMALYSWTLGRPHVSMYQSHALFYLLFTGVCLGLSHLHYSKVHNLCQTEVKYYMIHETIDTTQDVSPDILLWSTFRWEAKKNTSNGGYHTTSYVSMTAKSVALEKKTGDPFQWTTRIRSRISFFLPSTDLQGTAHLLDSMTSFLKKPKVEATPWDFFHRTFFLWNFWRQPPNIPIGCCSREASC